MVERPLDALIDHAAALQRQVDQLSREVQLLAFAALCLATAFMLTSFRVWHDD